MSNGPEAQMGERASARTPDVGSSPARSTIYVLELCYPYEGCQIYGVFSSRELAEEHREYLVREKKHYAGDLHLTDWTLDGLVTKSDKERSNG